MKLYSLSLIVTFLIIFTSCEKITWDLPRDNPLEGSDSTNTNNTNSKGADIKFSKFTFVNEIGYGNGDNVMNADEIIKLTLTLKNVGSASADHVSCNITTSSSYISNFNQNKSWNVQFYSGSTNSDFPSNSERTATTDFSFKIISTTPIGTTIPFSLSITDDNGKSWSDSFSITVN